MLSFWNPMVVVLFTGSVQVALAQSPAHVPQAVVGAKVGSPTNFTCQSHGIPITTCLWERIAPMGSYAKTLILSVTPANARQGESIQPGYIYVGDGLQRGEGGVTIANVKEDDNGSWKCTLITDKGVLYKGEVDLGILRKPDQPKFNPNALGKIVDNDDYRNSQPQPQRIVCFSGNGQPAPTFQWFINQEPILVGLSPLNTTMDPNTRINYTFQELVNHKFTWKDNGKKLRCVAVHDAFGPNDNRETSMDINIEFAPRPTREDIGKHVSVRAEIGAEKVLSVNVSANPKPSEIIWTVGNITILQGESTEKYISMIIRDVEPGVWEANLKITSVDENDVNKQFILKVTNSIGSGTVEFNFVIVATKPSSIHTYTTTKPSVSSGAGVNKISAILTQACICVWITFAAVCKQYFTF